MAKVKVLKGITSEALTFMRQNWRGLVRVTFMPFVLYVLCSAIQLKILQGTLASLVEAAPGADAQAIKLETSTAVEMISLITSIISPAAVLLAFVQVVRYRGLGEANPLPHGVGWKSYGLSLFYMLGMALLGLASYVAGNVIVTMPVSLASPVLGIFAWIAIAIFSLWFLCRFLVGLPGVALGHKPQFIKDIWPLAAHESWAVPLRMLAVFLLYNIAAAGMALPFALRVAGQLNLKSGQPPNDLEMLKALSSLIDRIFPVIAGVWLLTLPLIWMLSLLLTHAFQRLLAAQTK